jgi:hypothetical protein
VILGLKMHEYDNDDPACKIDAGADADARLECNIDADAGGATDIVDLPDWHCNSMQCGLIGLMQPTVLNGLIQPMTTVMMLLVMMVLITMAMMSATMLLVMKTVAMMSMHETAAGDNNDDDDVDENADCDSWDDDEYMTVTAMTATTFVYPLVCCYKVTVVH